MLKPMLASLADAPLDDPELVYEPKYDGIRAIAEVSAGRRRPPLVAPRQREDRAVSRRSRRRSTRWARRRQAAGRPRRRDRRARREGPADRISAAAGTHPSSPARSRTASGPRPASRSSSSTCCATAPPTCAIGRCSSGARRSSVCSAKGDTAGILRLSELVRGDGRALYERALASGWEGLIAKHADSLYKSGKRTPDWRKLKIVHEQEFVVGGWTEPRQTRAPISARCCSASTTANDARLRRSHRHRLQRAGAGAADEAAASRSRRRACPFTSRPKTNERPHWVEPRARRADQVHRVDRRRQAAASGLPRPARRQARRRRPSRDSDATPCVRSLAARTRTRRSRASERRRTSEGRAAASRDVRSQGRSPRAPLRAGRLRLEVNDALVEQLKTLEEARRDGVLDLGGGQRLSVTNLHKVFWPKQKLTKGDLFRYYVRVAPFILPAIADRPLVMKRFPNGIAGKPFYQHRAAEVPPGVRVEPVPAPAKHGARTHHRRRAEDAALHDAARRASRRIRGSRASQSPAFADYAALDLDPSPGVTVPRRCSTSRAGFATSSTSLGAVGVPKTSGRRRPARLHPAAARHAVRSGPALLPDRRDGRRAASIRSDATIERTVARARQARLRRLPAEHPRQDAGDRLQRARQRLCRRVDAAHVGGSRRRRRRARISRSRPCPPGSPGSATSGPL